MSIPRGVRILVSFAAIVIATLFTGNYLLAHCDGLDGPVVQAGERALAEENANYALVWVRPEDEPELVATFRQALEVRQLSPEAREVADRHFFETLVRLHRAGEGAPYTGLKPAGRDLGPAIPAADEAIVTGDLDAVEDLLTREVVDGLRRHFTDLRAHRRYDPDDVARGREFVRRYVEFIHYVEGIHQSATGQSEGHYPDSP